MNDLFKYINKYFPNSNDYKIYNNAIVFNNNDKRYVIKKCNNIKKTYNYLKSRSFEYIPNITFLDNNIYVYEYDNDSDIPNETKIKDIIYLSSLMHSKTYYFKDISLDEIKEKYESLINKNNDTYKFYMNMINLIEHYVYPSPSYYLLSRNISMFLNALDFSKQMINKWYEHIKKEPKIREVLLHNNLSLNHYVNSYDKKKLISLDKCSNGLCIYDFINLYKKYYDQYDFIEIYNIYNNKFKILESEKLLMYAILFIPDKIDFNNNEIINTKKVYKTCNYLYKTNELFMKNEAKYTKEEDNKINEQKKNMKSNT